MIVTFSSMLTTVFITFSIGLLIEGIIEKLDIQTIDSELPVSLILLLGFFGVSFILMIIHFFIPITLIVYIFISLFSIYSLSLQRQKLKKIFSKKIFCGKKQLLFLPLLLICGLILLFHSIDPNYEFDLGLYHLQNINWYQTNAIVPGLGNLHCRLAFNSNWFLLESLFGNRFVFRQPIFPINAVIIYSFITFALASIDKFENNFLSGKTVFFIFVFSAFTIFSYANSSSNDKPCDILIWIIIYLFINKVENHSINKWDKYSWVMIILSVFAFTIKVSSAVLFLLIGVHILIAYKHQKRPVIASLLISICYLTIWFIRNLIISGTIVFPIPFLQIPFFDWSIPKNLIYQLITIINLWAIKGHSYSYTVASMSFIEKFILWQTKRTIFFNAILFSGFIGSITYLIFDVGKSIKHKSIFKIEQIAYPLLDIYFVLAITYWYFSAPDPRFAYGPILASASWVFARSITKIRFSKIFIDCTLLFLLIFSVWLTYITIPWNGLRTYFINPPRVPEYSIREFTLADGNTINIPTEGIQCWDAPLPCTGWVYDGLIMRSNNMSDGFKIEK
jgi:hypothetical protein